MDNTFVPPYVPENLKWFERDGLETWYRQSKCSEFLEDTDSHFQQKQTINFGMISVLDVLFKYFFRLENFLQNECQLFEIFVVFVQTN